MALSVKKHIFVLYEITLVMRIWTPSMTWFLALPKALGRAGIPSETLAYLALQYNSFRDKNVP